MFHLLPMTNEKGPYQNEFVLVQPSFFMRWPGDLEEQLKNTKNELYVVKSEILLGVGRLGNTKRQQVIQWHFLEYMTVEDIAEQLNASKRYVYKMLNESYQILADKKAFSVKRARGAA